jgi:hypothetical protein
MKMFNSETESIDFYRKNKGADRFFIINYADPKNPYYTNSFDIIDTDRGHCGEDKQHWSDPICVTTDEDDARLIVASLEETL